MFRQSPPHRLARILLFYLLTRTWPGWLVKFNVHARRWRTCWRRQSYRARNKDSKIRRMAPTALQHQGERPLDKSIHSRFLWKWHSLNFRRTRLRELLAGHMTAMAAAIRPMYLHGRRGFFMICKRACVASKYSLKEKRTHCQPAQSPLLQMPRRFQWRKLRQKNTVRPVTAAYTTKPPLVQ